LISKVKTPVGELAIDTPNSRDIIHLDMKLLLLMIIAVCTFPIGAQTRVRLNDASKAVDVDVDIGKCREGNSILCGPLKMRFFRKGAKLAFQTIVLPETSSWDSIPQSNETKRYDDQSIINFRDFDFDGREDVAICDGTDGGYGMPSYRIYIYSPTQKRCVYSRSFTQMNDGGLGMFETDKAKRMHLVYTKSGCCWHQTQGFDVHNGRPRKVYEYTADDTGDLITVKLTTRKLINGKWRTWTKHAKTSEYFK
jgi:hypothetical protein